MSFFAFDFVVANGTLHFLEQPLFNAVFVEPVQTRQQFEGAVWFVLQHADCALCLLWVLVSVRVERNGGQLLYDILSLLDCQAVLHVVHVH